MSAPSKLSPETIAAFLERLWQHGKVEPAAKSVGISKGMVYAYLKRHPVFAAEVKRAQQQRRPRRKRALDLMREARLTILADPAAGEQAELDAGHQRRKLGTEKRRQQQNGAAAVEPTPVSEVTREALREAAYNAFVLVLSTPFVSIPEWRDFAALARADQLAILERARNPTARAPVGGEAVTRTPTPAGVTEAMQAIIDGASVAQAIGALRDRRGARRVARGR